MWLRNLNAIKNNSKKTEEVRVELLRSIQVTN